MQKHNVHITADAQAEKRHDNQERQADVLRCSPTEDPMNKFIQDENQMVCMFEHAEGK